MSLPTRPLQDSRTADGSFCSSCSPGLMAAEQGRCLQLPSVLDPSSSVQGAPPEPALLGFPALEVWERPFPAAQGWPGSLHTWCPQASQHRPATGLGLQECSTDHLLVCFCKRTTISFRVFLWLSVPSAERSEFSSRGRTLESRGTDLENGINCCESLLSPRCRGASSTAPSVSAPLQE